MPDEVLSLEKNIGVFESLSGKFWCPHDINQRDVTTIMQQYGVSESLSRILLAREVSTDDLEDFLQPTLRKTLSDPFNLLDMSKAVETIIGAIKSDEVIGIFGDYDVDGATSSSVLINFFKKISVKYEVYIPDRVKEGYGPSAGAFKLLAEKGVKTCITVDCGTNSFEAMQAADDLGMKIIVLDHHIGGEMLPKAAAIVNPNRLDEVSEYGYLAAVGVTFLFLIALNKSLRGQDFYLHKDEPNLLELLDLVALGTVCDVVPLKGLNRTFVKQGLKVLAHRNNQGLKALCDIAALEESPETYHLGFVIGPRINAGGRVGKSSLGTMLLTSDDYGLAYEYGQELDKYNKERKAIEQIVLEDAMSKSHLCKDSNIIIVSGKGWHEGVIGIVAGRIKEEFYKPVAVISINDGVGKASARSILGVDLGSAVIAAKQQGLLLAGGGHAMAAGFSVDEDKIDDLTKFLSEKIAKDVKANSVQKHYYDAIISVGGVTFDLLNSYKEVAPFGVANPEPRFVLKAAIIVRIDIVGKDHLRIILSESRIGGSTVTAMFFRSVGSDIGQMLLNSKGHCFDFYGKMKLNKWQGIEKIQFIIEDVCKSD